MKGEYMKQLTLKIGAVMIILSMLLSFTVITSSAATQPTTYSQTSNSGQRDVVCTTLSGTSASSYYTGSYTYDALSSLSASQLKTSLSTLMKKNHDLSSYNDCKVNAYKTDCENENGKVSLLYTAYSANQSDFSGSAPGWNREHVWPQSLGGGNTSNGGADMHHIRPDDVTTNSKRGNLKYGEVTGGTQAYGSTLVGGISGGTYDSTYFEPHDNVKGDVARICLYVYVRWGSDWGADNITDVFQSVDVLLQWCEDDPVDTWEMGRNEVVEAIQGNRNVFIDYPEYAWLIFGREVPDDMQTPSGMAMSTSGGGTTGGGTTGDTTCTHATTEVRDAVTATCSSTGYTGDTYCKSCGVKLSSGTTVSKLPHTEGAWIIDSNPTATESGSRHTECSVCGATVRTEPIPPTSNVNAFVSSVGYMKMAVSMLYRYKYAVMALDYYDTLTDDERTSVASTYAELTELLDAYNSDAETENDAHNDAVIVVSFLMSREADTAEYALLPSKKYV